MFKIQKNRHLKIAYHMMNKDDFCTSDELAEVTGLSPRTIKSEMGFISDLFNQNGAEFIAKKSDGYSYRVTEPGLFESFRKRLNLLFFYYDNLSDLNSYLRLVHIVRVLLASNGPVSVDMLANELETNRRGIKNELSMARKLFAAYHMHLKSSNGSLILDQDEKWMRLFCVAAFGISYHQFEKRLPEESFQELFSCNEKQFQLLRNEILKVLIRKHVHLTDYRCQEFCRYLVITCNRNYMGKSIELSHNETAEAMQLMVYPAAEDVATVLEQLFSITLSCSEICVIAEYLMCNSDLTSHEITAENFGSYYDKAVKTNRILEEYLLARWGMPVHEETENCFLPKCASFVVREAFGFLSLKDLLISSCETSISFSPMAMKVGEDIINCLYEQFGCYGNAHDYFDFAQLAYCRLHDISYPQKKLRIAVVTGFGRENSRKTIQYLKKYFGLFIESIDAYELYELRDLSPSQIDAVVGAYPEYIYNYSIPLINFEKSEGMSDLSQIWNDLFYRTNQVDKIAQKIADIIVLRKDVSISSIDEACEKFAIEHHGDVELAHKEADHTENYDAEFICASNPCPCKIYNVNVNSLGNETVEIHCLKNPIVLKGKNRISTLIFIALDYADDPGLLKAMTSLLEVFKRDNDAFEKLLGLPENERKDFIEELLLQEIRML